MPRAPRICSNDSCANTQPCRDHPVIPWEGSTSRGFPPPIRRYILERDPLCVQCHSRPSVIADHIVPKAEGGNDDPSNGQGLCADCDRTKTAADSAWGRAHRHD